MTNEAISDSQTNVIWGFNGKADYPMNLMLKLIGMEEMLGNQLQEGLNKLKSNLEE